MKEVARRLSLDAPATYQIKVQGRLNETWSAWFDGMAVTVENSGDGAAVTTLTGSVADQVALHSCCLVSGTWACRSCWLNA